MVIKDGFSSGIHDGKNRGRGRVAFFEKFKGGLEKMEFKEGKLFLSYEDFRGLVFNTFLKVLKSKKGFDLLVAIETGGYEIGRIIYELSKSKEIRSKVREKYGIDLSSIVFDSIRVESYNEDNQPGKLSIVRDLNFPVKGKRVLLVDDVSDRGNTLNFVNSLLMERGAEVITATLHIKEGTSFIPDFYSEKIGKDVWIVYPAEKEATSSIFYSLISRE